MKKNVALMLSLMFIMMGALILPQVNALSAYYWIGFEKGSLTHVTAVSGYIAIYDHWMTYTPYVRYFWSEMLAIIHDSYGMQIAEVGLVTTWKYGNIQQLFVYFTYFVNGISYSGGQVNIGTGYIGQSIWVSVEQTIPSNTWRAYYRVPNGQTYLIGSHTWDHSWQGTGVISLSECENVQPSRSYQYTTMSYTSGLQYFSYGWYTFGDPCWMDSSNNGWKVNAMHGSGYWYDWVYYP